MLVNTLKTARMGAVLAVSVVLLAACSTSPNTVAQGPHASVSATHTSSTSSATDDDSSDLPFTTWAQS
jgi:hypothetical protein